ncbi:hypothetical protein PG988_012529 [Apiospora saccharicola]
MYLLEEVGSSYSCIELPLQDLGEHLIGVVRLIHDRVVVVGLVALFLGCCLVVIAFVVAVCTGVVVVGVVCVCICICICIAPASSSSSLSASLSDSPESS